MIKVLPAKPTIVTHSLTEPGPQMDLKRKVIGSTFWVGIEGIGKEVLSFLVFILLARMLNPEAYGLIAIATVLISFLATLSELGLQKTIIQAGQITSSQLNSAFWLSVSLGVLMYAGLWVSAPIFSSFFDEPELVDVVRWLGVTVLLRSLTVVQAGLFTRNFRFRLLATKSILSIGLGGCVGISMALQGYEVSALVAQQLTAAAIGALILWLSSSWKPNLSFSWASVKLMAPFSLPVTGSNLIDVTNRQADKLLIGAFLGKFELGAYSIAYKVFGVAYQVILDSLSRIAFPTFSELRGDLDKLGEVYYSVVSVSSAISLPIFILLTLSVDPLVPLLFGDQWARSIPILEVLMLANCINSINVFSPPVLLSLGRAKTVLRLNIFKVTVNLLALTIAVNWGGVAVAGALAVCSALMTPLHFYFLRHYAGLSFCALFRRLRAQLYGLIGIVIASFLLRTSAPEVSDIIFLAMLYSTSAVIYAVIVSITDRGLSLQILHTLVLALKRNN